MATIRLEDIPPSFANHLQRVGAGETLLITSSGLPIAEIKPVGAVSRKPRPFGLCAGEFVLPDDFDAPLPEDVLSPFESRSGATLV